ncbi:MAG: phosphoribosyl-ATP diphosphatase, partial [Myxococcota bacterium]
RLGADAQVGMALYSGRLSYADALMATVRTDRADGLFTTVVADEHGVALGLVYSSRESVAEAIKTRSGVYWSRSRNSLWRKGATSGNQQALVKIDVDCDRDALRFTVRQTGDGFCHLGDRTCWGDEHSLGALERMVRARRHTAPEGSYTKRLFDDSELLGKKIREEAQELVDAQTHDEIVWEAADVIYFTFVRMAAAGVSLEDVEKELARRTLKVRRRGGDAKE